MENEELKKEVQVQEAEITELENDKNKPKKKKYDFLVELILFFALGILIGVAVKNEAVKRITMGFEDYKMKIEKQDYSIIQIKEELLKKQEEEQAQEEQKESEEKQPQ